MGAARLVVATVTVTLTVLAACGSSPSSTSSSSSSSSSTISVDNQTAGADTVAPTADADVVEQLFPDVIDATAEASGDTWTVSATLSSPYDTPERYADAWRVIGPDGTVYAERILTHDHANEQPFTRSQPGVEIPDDVSEVTIEGRDLANGYGGDTFVLTLDR